MEARLFEGAGAETVKVHRVPTPTDSFDGLMSALIGQVDWLRAESGDPSLPVGVAIPGVIDPATGESFASNIPASGHSIPAALKAHFGEAIPVVNDCMAFAFSEAQGGAGDGHRVVMGLILGTGVGGGVSIDGAIPPRHAGLAVEVGHIGMSYRAIERHGLPMFRCGCGRLGCVENYISGTGFKNIAEWKTGTRHGAEALGTEPALDEVLDIWADIAGDVLDTIQLALDPDCIVIGGGLSNLPGVADRLTTSLEALRLGSARMPLITVAQHGDSSGARGAALMGLKA
ncbi:ROK family protein [Pelagovum pacificum]|uniref:ROK family protein n=1 Tax=Pelagovum pacificum TaxID=2588711 RepID=UPI001E354C42|nr:ROK family protein [Pelagovum pacificum]